jgi:hypothetical protein
MILYGTCAVKPEVVSLVTVQLQDTLLCAAHSLTRFPYHNCHCGGFLPLLACDPLEDMLQ